MADYGMQRREPSAWAVGFTGFAGFLMIMIGLFHAVVGLAGILTDQVYIATPTYVFQFSALTWGWAHLILGVIVFAAGIGLFSGAIWARAVAVIFALSSAVANFLFLPYYPAWAVLIIALDVAVIWAVTAHGRDITMETK